MVVSHNHFFSRTVAIDMRGYSESDAPRGIWQYTMEKLVADVKEVITQLGKTNTFQNILLYLDVGSIISIWMYTA